MLMPETLQGKTVLISGPPSDFGRALEKALSQAGPRVVLSDIDVSKSDEISNLVDRVVSEFGSLDFACNIAESIGKSGLVTDFSEEDWNRIVDANSKRIWLAMKYEIRQMLKQGRGAIVNVLVRSELNGTQDSSLYSANTHAVVGLTKSAALEYAKRDIRINAACFGAGSSGKTEDVTGLAQTVLWLCSDAASFVTGQVIEGSHAKVAV